jgi:hypothetical protein
MVRLQYEIDGGFQEALTAAMGREHYPAAAALRHDSPDVER